MGKQKKRFVTILVLGMITAIGPFSIDMYLPSFGDIARHLDTTIAKVSLSLSSFFIGISAGQFLYGPLLDRFGRKRPLYMGLIIYIIASALCTLITSADMLIGLRFLQAIGGCAGMVASRAMVRDLFDVKDNAKIFSMLMLVVGVSPIVAPTLGGYLTAAWGWHSIFIALTIMGIIILAAVYFGLPESRKPDPTYSLKPASIVKGFWEVFITPQFFTYAFTGAIASAGLYAYIAGSPVVFLDIYKTTEKQYGLIFSLAAGGLILSSQLNSLLLRKHKSELIIQYALGCQIIVALTLVLGSWLGFIGLTGTILLVVLYLSCQGFTFPNSSALSMAPFTRNAGGASALMGAIQMGIGAFTSALVSYLSNNTTLPMTGVMAGCSITAFLILQGGRRYMQTRVTSKEVVEEETIEMLTNS